MAGAVFCGFCLCVASLYSHIMYGHRRTLHFIIAIIESVDSLEGRYGGFAGMVTPALKHIQESNDCGLSRLIGLPQRLR